ELTEIYTLSLHDALPILVRNDVVEQSLVVRDDDDCALGRAHRVDARCHELERIDVEARIGFVENGQLWVEQRHLEDLVAFLLTRSEEHTSELQSRFDLVC